MKMATADMHYDDDCFLSTVNYRPSFAQHLLEIHFLLSDVKHAFRLFWINLDLKRWDVEPFPGKNSPTPKLNTWYQEYNFKSFRVGPHGPVGWAVTNISSWVSPRLWIMMKQVSNRTLIDESRRHYWTRACTVRWKLDWSILHDSHLANAMTTVNIEGATVKRKSLLLSTKSTSYTDRLGESNGRHQTGVTENLPVLCTRHWKFDVDIIKAAEKHCSDGYKWTTEVGDRSHTYRHISQVPSTEWAQHFSDHVLAWLCSSQSALSAVKNGWWFTVARCTFPSLHDRWPGCISPYPEEY